MLDSEGNIWEHFMEPTLSLMQEKLSTTVQQRGSQWQVNGTTLNPAYKHFTGLWPLDT